MPKTPKAQKAKNPKRPKIKIVKRTRKSRLNKKRPAPKTIQVPILSHAFDLEGLLVDKILSSDVIAENGTSIENLIYNATPKMAEIGYSFGFSVGREMALKNQAEGEFTKALDRIGLHKSLYYPFNDRLIITSVPSKRVNRNLNHNIHVFESGVISGYLSVTTGLKMQTKESLCIHNGSNVCQFVSAPFSPKAITSKTEINNIIDGISHTIINNRYKKLKNEYYRILAYLPLLEHPMSEEVRKLMTISGRRIAENSNEKEAHRIIDNIASYFGANSEKISINSKGKSIIRLRYSSYNSIYPYVAMPTALIVGFGSGNFGKDPQVSILTNKDNTYTTIIEFKNNSE